MTYCVRTGEKVEESHQVRCSFSPTTSAIDVPVQPLALVRVDGEVKKVVPARDRDLVTLTFAEQPAIIPRLWTYAYHQRPARLQEKSDIY